MRRAAKRDHNHNAVADTFRLLGCSVFETDRVGDGFPDLVVGCLGLNHLVEVKNPETRYGQAGLNAAQLRFNEAWRGGASIPVSSEDEAIALVQNWRRAGR